MKQLSQENMVEFYFLADAPQMKILMDEVKKGTKKDKGKINENLPAFQQLMYRNILSSYLL